MLFASTLKFDHRALGLAALLTVALGASVAAHAQSDAAPAPAPVPVSFGSLAQAVKQQDYTIVQLRRFFTPAGIVAVREEVRVVANGTQRPNFELEYKGVVGEPVGSPLWQHWDQTYTQNNKLFFDHGLFRVRDLVKVQQNYTLHDFGPTTRAGRAARRIVVFPNLLDKAIWLLEVDTATHVPLYTAEYDAQLRLLSELEGLSLTVGAQLGSPTSSASTSTITVLPTYAAAKTFLGDPSGLVEPAGITAEYALDKVEVRTDPLNNRQTLLLGYSDGIDQFFVAQTVGVPDAFAGLPVRQRVGPSHTIARYRDPAMSVLLFWDGGIAFQVAGRGSLLRLDDFAREIYTRAILN